MTLLSIFKRLELTNRSFCIDFQLTIPAIVCIIYAEIFGFPTI